MRIARQTRPTVTRLQALASGVALLVVGFGGGWAAATVETGSASGGGGSDSADREQARFVATAFATFYAVHDPHACGVVTGALLVRLAREGRCSGPTPLQTPQMVTVTAAWIEVERAEFTLDLDPVGEFGTSTVSMTLHRVDVGRWLVQSLREQAR